MKLYKTLAIIFATCMIAIGFTSCSDDDDDSTQVAKAFTDALKEKFPEATNVKWEMKAQYRVAEFNHNMKDYDVWFDQGANWAMTEIDYGKDFYLVTDNAVNTTFEQTEYATWTVDDITSYERADIKFYIIEVEKTGQQDVDVYIRHDGDLIKTVTDTSINITPDTKI